MMAVDPKTGHVKAWVGGINHNWFKYDHVNKSATRQVGSTIKPFLYALTIDLRGYSPCQKFIDEPTTIRKGEGRFNLLRDWTPKNSSGGYSGAQMTMIQALQRSINSISARMMKELGNTEVFRSYLYNVGIDTSYSAKVGGSRIPAQPSICLGTPDLSVFEMTGAYTAFANEGVYTEPTYIARIEDRNGNLIYTATPKRKQVLNEHAAYAMVFLLKSVVAGSGGFNGIRSEIGGKTGTTQYQSDGWFIGISPNLVVGTWVGCDDRFVRFEGNLAMGQGAVMARPIFQNFFRSVEADKSLAFNSSASFVKPEEIEIETDCAKYTGGEDNAGGTDITEDTDSGNDEGKKNDGKWNGGFDDGDEDVDVDE
jgi:penicillin-binding protein 1A